MQRLEPVMGTVKRGAFVERASMKLGVIAAVVVLASTFAPVAHAQVTAWPADGDWVALTQEGVPVDEPHGDTNPGSIDIVGDAEAPPFYVSQNAEALYFRIRVDTTPIQGNSFRSFGWGCEIDTDGNFGAYEFIALLDGTAGSDVVNWLRNSVPRTDGSANDQGERLLSSRPVEQAARVVSAGTVFPTGAPDEDFFVDFAVSIADIQGTPSATPQQPADVMDLNGPMTFICGTSANTSTLSKDYGGLGLTLDELGSDPVLCDENGCTVCNVAAACGPTCVACGIGQACDPLTLTCQDACTSNVECTDPVRPFCNVGTSSCVECLADADCSTDDACNAAGACVPIDTDGDGLGDAIEVLAGTSPNDADSDDDGVPDGAELDWDQDTDGDGLINALDPDSDDDGLFDGTEMGFGCDGSDTAVSNDNCIADADQGVTTTSPVVADTDLGGISDGAEDSNRNGVVDLGELDPNVGGDDAGAVDSDGDGLPDDTEIAVGSDPADADTDGDGLPDGAERNPTDDTDGNGLVNLLDPDSDGDGLFDGTEAGRDCSTAQGGDPCIADGDGSATTTSVVIADTDGGGVTDGDEDVDSNGVVDLGETNPNDPADDGNGTGGGGAGGGGAGGTGGTSAGGTGGISAGGTGGISAGGTGGTSAGGAGGTSVGGTGGTSTAGTSAGGTSVGGTGMGGAAGMSGSAGTSAGGTGVGGLGVSGADAGVSVGGPDAGVGDGGIDSGSGADDDTAADDDSADDDIAVDDDILDDDVAADDDILDDDVAADDDAADDDISDDDVGDDDVADDDDAAGGAGPDLNQELEGGGCSCNLPNTGSTKTGLLALGLALATLSRRRRRR